MNNKKGVSVIIPCYNSEKTIRKCIESILGNKSCYEIIIIDDGSKDSTKSIVKELSKKNNIIKYYYKDNGGVSSARNLGLTKATGKYILFVDSDDFLEDKSIDNSYDFSIKNDLDICNFSMEEINFLRKNYTADLSKIDKEIFEKERLSEAFFKISMYSSCAKLFKESIIKDNEIKFNEKLTYSEDYIFSINVCKYVKKIGFCKDSIYYVENINPNSISKSYVKNMEESVLEKKKTLYELFEMYPNYKKDYFKLNMGTEHFWFITISENLFKNKTPYTFFEAYKIIKEKYKKFKKEPEYKDKRSEVKPKRKVDKIYYFLLHSNSPLLLAISLKAKIFLIKQKLKKKRG